MRPFLLTLSFSFFCFYFLSSQEWVPAGRMPDELPPRNHPINFSLEGKAYIGTGFFNESGQSFFTDDFARFDAETETWEVLPPVPGGPRAFAYGDTTENKGYMGFGVNSQEYLNDLWEYDPTRESWTQLPDCPCNGRRHPAFIAHAGYIHVGLGDNRNDGNLKDWWVYNIETSTWTQAPDLPGLSRHHPYYFGLNGKAYAGFGHGNYVSGEIKVYNDFYVYDPQTNEWTQLNDFPGEGRVAGTQFSRNGKGYVLSGQDEQHVNFLSGEFWEYTPETDTWEELMPHPGTARWAPGSFLLDSSVYLIAGRDNFGDQKDMFKYTFNDITSSNEETFVLEKEVLHVYPNPVEETLFVLSSEQWTQYEIVDLLGVKILSGSFKGSIDFNQSVLPTGVYTLILSKTDPNSGKILNRTSEIFHKK